ncbi:hypothetical protein ACQBAU_01390 [Propionibacteriaceae bacterium Y2011]
MPQDQESHPVSRRLFLGGAAVAGVTSAGLLTPAGSRARAEEPAQPHPTSRAAFDRLDAAINNGNSVKDETNDKDSSGLSGKLAWREAYALEGYALMYQAHRDTYYLDKMVDHIDHVLANRDSERGVTDYAGNSHPAWRADHLYTIGFTTVPDSSGRPMFEVRTALSWGDVTTVTITAGSGAGTFRLEAHNTFHNRTTLYENLSVDPASPDYALKRMFEGFRYEKPNRVLLTIRDLRDQPSGQDEISQGQFPMVSAPYVYGAHTGSIVHPMALFARLVREDEALMSDPTYRNRAELYLEAAADAVAVHDPEWRENEEGEGYYVAQAGAPVWNAGFDNAIGHFTPLGRAIVQLARVTGDRQYVERANAMGWTVRNSLVSDGRAWIWPSWWQKGAPYNGWDIDNPRSGFWPWYPPNRIIKNTSHAQHDVNFARDLHEAGLPGRPPFPDLAIRRFAATFTDNMMTFTEDGSPSVFRLVDGSRGIGTSGQEQMSTGFADLATWDSRVLDHSVAILANHMELGRLTMESAMYCLARVNHAAGATA